MESQAKLRTHAKKKKKCGKKPKNKCLQHLFLPVLCTQDFLAILRRQCTKQLQPTLVKGQKRTKKEGLNYLKHQHTQTATIKCY